MVVNTPKKRSQGEGGGGPIITKAGGDGKRPNCVGQVWGYTWSRGRGCDALGEGGRVHEWWLGGRGQSDSPLSATAPRGKGNGRGVFLEVKVTWGIGICPLKGVN